MKTDIDALWDRVADAFSVAERDQARAALSTVVTQGLLDDCKDESFFTTLPQWLLQFAGIPSDWADMRISLRTRVQLEVLWFRRQIVAEVASIEQVNTPESLAILRRAMPEVAAQLEKAPPIATIPHWIHKIMNNFVRYFMVVDTRKAYLELYADSPETAAAYARLRELHAIVDQLLHGKQVTQVDNESIFLAFPIFCALLDRGYSITELRK
ncbi:MAG: hypothetical protein HY817_01725 [Candidatus Abawacabacteria bacterium]|nr:hypothetical protein [Candidatus Abawacabacteria bacterium]